MKSIYSLDLEEIQEYFLSHNDKKFHAEQLFEWLYKSKCYHRIIRGKAVYRVEQRK